MGERYLWLVLNNKIIPTLSASACQDGQVRVDGKRVKTGDDSETFSWGVQIFGLGLAWKLSSEAVSAREQKPPGSMLEKMVFGKSSRTDQNFHLNTFQTWESARSRRAGLSL